ncbi:hypothetical protein [Aeromonas caviae]
MFLFKPELYIRWLGYPSEGDFYAHAFNSPKFSRHKIHPPCSKTLNRYLLLKNKFAGSKQADNFFLRLQRALLDCGVDPAALEVSEQPILIGQHAIRELWPSFIYGVKITDFYPATCVQAEAILSHLQAMLETLNGLQGKEKGHALAANHWVQTCMIELGMETILEDTEFNDIPAKDSLVLVILNCLNIYCFIAVLSTFDAEINQNVAMEFKRSIFSKLMPCLLLDEWSPHRLGLFEPLLNSFETKTAGYKALARNAGCDDASIKSSLQKFYGKKINLRYKTAKVWIQSALEAHPKRQEFDLEEVIGLSELIWGVASILSGWIHEVRRLQLVSDDDLVTCFSHYQRYFNAAIVSRRPQASC